jgi:F-type H+-transporting ATPase subunit b
MLIDWFTVVAEIVNFLVLVALLRHFLWGRLVRAIDEREARVAGKLAQAEEQAKEARQQMEDVRARALEMEHRRDEMIVQAKKEADEQRNRLIEKARESVRELETRWREDLDHERTAFFRELRRRAAGEVLTVIRRALADLASSEVQQAAIQVFLEKLHSLDLATLKAMAAEELLLRSAVELPEATQQQVRTVLRERLSAAPRLRFECDPAMAWGLELRGNGRKIGWNPESYLDSMEENLNQALDRRADTVSRAAS